LQVAACHRAACCLEFGKFRLFALRGVVQRRVICLAWRPLWVLSGLKLDEMPLEPADAFLLTRVTAVPLS
jgi:hypothetical protein